MPLTGRFTGGMYKGKMLVEVLEENSSYVNWLLNNVPSFKMDTNANMLFVAKENERFKQYKR